jgi:nitrogen fixation protein FixH
MLIIMVAFFGVVIGVNVTLAVLAAGSWTGLVVKNSYVASQEFQEKLDALQAQEALGWTPELAVDADRARLTVTDAAGRPVDLGADVELHFNRPIGDGEDQTLQMSRAVDGSYTAAATLRTGAWDAVVLAPGTSAGAFEMHQRIVVQ